MRTRRVLPVNVALVLIGVLDLLSTIFWVQGGQATEHNPLMAAVLNTGMGPFILVKLGTLGAYVATIEWYRRRRNPEFARIVSNITVFAYLVVYAVSFVWVNGRFLLG